MPTRKPVHLQLSLLLSQPPAASYLSRCQRVDLKLETR